MHVNKKWQSESVCLNLAAVAVNSILIFAFYVAKHNFAHSGYAENRFTLLAKMCFCIGIVALMLILIARRRMEKFLTGCLLVIGVTLWNQACLLAFLIATAPFKLFERAN